MSAMLAETRPDAAQAVVEAPHRERKRVVIIGGGFAGLAAARALRHADAEVVLIDRRNHHIFQPLLYQVATAVLSPARSLRRFVSSRRSSETSAYFWRRSPGSTLPPAPLRRPPPVRASTRLRSIIWWSRPACAPAISDTTNSRDMRRVSRALATPRRFEPKSWARSNWPQRPTTRTNARDK